MINEEYADFTERAKFCGISQSEFIRRAIDDAVIKPIITVSPINEKLLFCRKHFEGHQAIVCTHADGHNHSGNIHCHLVINSLQIADVPILPYMDRLADTRAGCKHRCTEAAMNYFRAEVMEMCHREGLYQIDLLGGSGERVTEGEYWIKRRGQAELSASGKPTKFETNKEKLRKIIRKSLEAATDFENFAKLLSREGVTVKQSRGRLSYLASDRVKPITARRLGDDFDLAAINAAFEQKMRQVEQNGEQGISSRAGILERLQAAKTSGYFVRAMIRYVGLVCKRHLNSMAFLAIDRYTLYCNLLVALLPRRISRGLTTMCPGAILYINNCGAFLVNLFAQPQLTSRTISFVYFGYRSALAVQYQKNSNYS